MLLFALWLSTRWSSQTQPAATQCDGCCCSGCCSDYCSSSTVDPLPQVENVSTCLLQCRVSVAAVRVPCVTRSSLSSRVFVNRSLAMEKIKCFGFDMDYTLAGERPASLVE